MFLFDKVEKSPGCGDDDIDPPLEILHLAVLADAAEGHGMIDG